jgi:hypothetical protein
MKKTVKEIDQNKRCAVGVSFVDGSCIDLDILIKLVSAYNKYCNETKTGNIIKLLKQNDGTIVTEKIIEKNNTKDIKDIDNTKEKYKKYLIKEMTKRHKNIKQKDWVNEKFTKYLDKKIKDILIYNTFRPTGPNGKFEWLNTLNINHTMKQYENKYKEFKFFGAVPIDFNELNRYEIQNLDFSKFEAGGKYKIGIIFNLDEHYKSGSHWVGLYSDLKKGQIYYYDSYGIKPENRIKALIKKIALYLLKKKIKVIYESNKHRHQYKNSECGVYSINFILRMLKGDTFKDICIDKTSDDKINKCRNVYFNNTNI